MSELSPEQRSLRAKIAAETRWAKVADRTKATEPARLAAAQRFYDEARRLHPGAPNSVITRAAENLRRAHLARMTLAAAKAKAQAKTPPSPKRSGGDDQTISESELNR